MQRRLKALAPAPWFRRAPGLCAAQRVQPPFGSRAGRGGEGRGLGGCGHGQQGGHTPRPRRAHEAHGVSRRREADPVVRARRSTHAPTRMPRGWRRFWEDLGTLLCEGSAPPPPVWLPGARPSPPRGRWRGVSSRSDGYLAPASLPRPRRPALVGQGGGVRGRAERGEYSHSLCWPPVRGSASRPVLTHSWDREKGRVRAGGKQTSREQKAGRGAPASAVQAWSLLSRSSRSSGATSCGGWGGRWRGRRATPFPGVGLCHPHSRAAAETSPSP